MIQAAIGGRPFRIFLGAWQPVRRSTAPCAGSHEPSSFTFVGFAKTGFKFHDRTIVPSRLAGRRGRSISTRQSKSRHNIALEPTARSRRWRAAAQRGSLGRRRRIDPENLIDRVQKPEGFGEAERLLDRPASHPPSRGVESSRGCANLHRHVGHRGCLDEEFRVHSRRLIDGFVRGDFRLVLSELTLLELEPAPLAVRDVLAEVSVDHIEAVRLTPEADELARRYLAEGILPANMLADAQHIAIASIANVDVLVSWNFRHVVNLSRIHAYHGVNARQGYPSLEIRSPREVLGDE